MAVRNLTDEQIERRLDMLEKIIASADPKDLPALNRTFQLLLDEQVRRDILISDRNDLRPGESTNGN